MILLFGNDKRMFYVDSDSTLRVLDSYDTSSNYTTVHLHLSSDWALSKDYHEGKYTLDDIDDYCDYIGYPIHEVVDIIFSAIELLYDRNFEVTIIKPLFHKDLSQQQMLDYSNVSDKIIERIQDLLPTAPKYIKKIFKEDL